MNRMGAYTLIEELLRMYETLDLHVSTLPADGERQLGFVVGPFPGTAPSLLPERAFVPVSWTLQRIDTLLPFLVAAKSRALPEDMALVAARARTARKRWAAALASHAETA